MSKRFSKKMYGEYPVIIDNNNDTEMTLDFVVNSLNEYEFMQKNNIKEYNQLTKRINFISERRDKIADQNIKLKKIILFLILIIIFETLFLLGVR